MKKKFKIEGIDCANCAAKLEGQIQKLEGIVSASIHFMTQKLTLEIQENTDWNAILDEVEKLCRRHEPDCKIIR